jgi:hypothetical protein
LKDRNTERADPFGDHLLGPHWESKMRKLLGITIGMFFAGLVLWALAANATPLASAANKQLQQQSDTLAQTCYRLPGGRITCSQRQQTNPSNGQ